MASLIDRPESMPAARDPSRLPAIRPGCPRSVPGGLLAPRRGRRVGVLASLVGPVPGCALPVRGGHQLPGRGVAGHQLPGQ
jgi:hypothetical protein